MPVRPLSLEAFGTVDLTAGQAAVLAAIGQLLAEGVKPTDQAVALRLGWAINRVTPRRGELVEQQRIYKAGVVKGWTGRRMAWWQLWPSRVQLEMFSGKEIDFG